jgi:hypothetical protein
MQIENKIGRARAIENSHFLHAKRRAMLCQFENCLCNAAIKQISWQAVQKSYLSSETAPAIKSLRIFLARSDIYGIFHFG